MSLRCAPLLFIPLSSRYILMVGLAEARPRWVTAAYARCMPEDMTEESPDNHAEPVAVAVHPDRGEAEVTVAHLAANGIEAFIVDQVEGGTIPMEGEWGVAVVVKAVDADLAREVLAADVEIEGDLEGDVEGDVEV